MDTCDDPGKQVELTRRKLIASGAATGFVAGFALSVQPVVAQSPIVTDSAGLDAGAVQIPTPTGPIPGYRAVPAGGRNRPLMLVAHEIFGVHEQIRDVCRRLAKLGYCAVAPYLYHRQGDVTGLKTLAELLPLLAKVPDSQVMSDLDATVAWAVASGAADQRRLGITGFSWGGIIVWLYAVHNPSVKAGVAWYGRLAGPKNENNPAHPVDVAPRIKVPVLGLYGGADAGVPLATVEQMRQALGPGSRSMIHVYPDMPHGFFADYRPSYREAAAKDGWQRLIDWFKKAGVA
ncbi:MAG: dienelactone hydrolase family protein [Hyphomicrobiaceae bacterium]|nr:MAG: dienelactone hydrolase family protein [Hyphomicrobiaceae bacterium]